MTARAALIAKCTIWRDRAPSGLYVMHGARQDHYCPRHGLVTKWHECDWHRPKAQRPRVVRVA